MTGKRVKTNVQGFIQRHSFSKKDGAGLPSTTFVLKSGAGFSLVELIIYVGVLSLILIALSNMAFIIQSSRFRFSVQSDIHSAASRVLSTVNFLVRNADGFVDDENGNDCFYTDKLWLYFATSSAKFLPPGCAGGYASTAVSVELSGTDGTESPGGTALTSDGKFLYAANGTSVTKRYLSDLSLDSSFGTAGTITLTVDSRQIVVDNGYLYIAGHNSSLFAVEKRLASTGAVDTTFDSDGYVISSAIGYALGLAVDGGAIYLAGDTGANGDWHIEKRDKVYGALCSGTICGGVAFDTDGMIDLTGNLYSELHDIAIDGTYMYLAGEYFYHTGGFPGTNWDGSVLEKRLLTTGAVDTGFGGGDGNKIDDFTTEATAIEIDGTYMYVAGHDATYNWRARKFSLSDGTFQCIGFGINGTIPRDIAIDSSSMYVSGQNGPVAGSNELILEKRNLSDCELDTSFASPDGYFIGTVDDGGVVIKKYNSILYTSGGANGIQSFLSTTGDVSAASSGVRLVCYQNYPNIGKNASCSADPLNSHTQIFELVDASKVRILSGDLSFATTTIGSRQAIETTMNVGFDSQSLPPNFFVATYTTSSTAAFRKAP